MAFCQQKSCVSFVQNKNTKMSEHLVTGGNNKIKMQWNKELKLYKTHYKMYQEKWNSKDR